MSPATRTGTCGCGAAVEREIATGPFADMVNGLPFHCDQCAERELAERDAADGEEDASRALTGRRRALESCGLPRSLREVEFDALDHDGCGEAIDAAKRWASAGGGLVLTGPIGTGKTTIAAAAMRLRLVAGQRDRWASTPLLMARLGSGFDTPQRKWALETLTGASGALVLDDADKCRPTEYGAEQMFLAVDGAVTNGCPLLLTTNLSIGGLAGRWPQPYGEAIVSRLVGYCDVVAVTGPDRRLGGAV